ncbi:Imidazolonepropionase [Pseudoalteromonas holothuriae]|uniref:Imidazolonepropionase n=1 Tax=Pseudoalteromonas holothuriae TaxID=2963714 RepID=A0A9W4QS59_9GAMM|nr:MULTISPECIES: amidohydrolase family protein [unclassified Pseudoalteromonas]CAH9050747.1 Imidazolonepropionase [Pseudoalteromonas sp. CIP111854]CAH9059749.1 Imidazolonepropionase [Pseudoalteromonas sp. CIP111951]
MHLIKYVYIILCFALLFCTIAACQNLHSPAKIEEYENSPNKIAFVGANVVNPGVSAAFSNTTILVEQGNIIKLQPSSNPIPNGYKVFNLKGKWVIPGLIDGHIHLAQSGGAFTRPDTIDATKLIPYQQDQQWLLDNTANILKRYLQLGITTVFDLGGPSEYLKHYRQVSSSGVFPNIFAAGTLLSPMTVPQLSINGNTFTQVNSTQSALELVKKQLQYNTHIIKIVWSQETGLSSEQLYDLYQPAIALAHQHNKVVAIHVEDLRNAKMAVKAGGNILVHGVITDPIDNELITLMKLHDVTYMPTLSAYSHYFDLFKGSLSFTDFEQAHAHKAIIDSFMQLTQNAAKTDQMFQLLLKYVPMVDMPAADIAKLTQREQSIIGQLRGMFSSRFEDIQKSNLKLAANSGLNIAFGTDAGNPGTLHAVSIFGEMAQWQNAGLSKQHIITAMTYGNAKAFKLQDKLGSLLAGKQADFIVLEHNPYKNLDSLKHPIMVVKRGAIIKPNAK